MDRHIKRLDVKIKDLQNEGLFPTEAIPLPTHPSITDSKLTQRLSHSRNASRRVSPSIHVRSSSLNLDKSTLSGVSTPTATNSANPLSAAVTSGGASAGTSGATSGHDTKRRKLTSASGANIGNNAGTVGGGATPSISSTLANAGATTPGPGSAGLSGRGSVENGRPTDGVNLPSRTGPGIKRGGMKVGGAGHKRRIQHEQEDEDEEEDEDDDDDEENGDDKRLYCYCQQVSWGNMVACDDSDCRYEWFHWGGSPLLRYTYAIHIPPLPLRNLLFQTSAILHNISSLPSLTSFTSLPILTFSFSLRMCQSYQRTTREVVL